MTHPKMLYTYVGVDSHKDEHTAVFLDCFFEKLGELTVPNLPSAYEGFLYEAEKLKADGTGLLFGLEDVSAYGRTLAAFLLKRERPVKHVNARLVAMERKSRNITEKTDSVDAECTARVLLSKFTELPDADLQDKYWILRTLVIRRNFIVKTGTRLKNHLHTLLTHHYPNYTAFFRDTFCKTSLAFFTSFPSPSCLANVSLETLAGFLHELSNGKHSYVTAEKILRSLENTEVQFQEIRDMAVRSAIRQIESGMHEIERIEEAMAEFLDRFGCTLTSMTGIDIVTAAKLLSCIGDIRKFPSPAKLARYSGVAPVTYASGRKEIQWRDQRGNRELHSVIYGLAVRLIGTVSYKNTVLNPFFYEYYLRKLSEGKTKRQALKCVERRLVNIIWNMLTHDEEYINPPMYSVPKHGTIRESKEFSHDLRRRP